MARITIRLIVNPETRKRDVVIDYESDQDAMAMEHEDDHGKIVDQLIEGGALNAAELGKIIVNRDNQGQQQVEIDESNTQEERKSLENDN